MDNKELEMDTETPIEQLTDNKESTENTSIINEILSEIHNTPEPKNEPNISLNETSVMNNIQQDPINPTNVNHPTIQPSIEETPIQQIPIEQHPIHQPEQQPIFNEPIKETFIENDEPNLMENLESTENTFEYLKDNILEELKLPTVVLILFIIFGSSRIDSFFIKTGSNFFVDNTGKITFPSLFIKAIIVALIFYIFKLFV